MSTYIDSDNHSILSTINETKDIESQLSKKNRPIQDTSHLIEVDLSEGKCKEPLQVKKETVVEDDTMSDLAYDDKQAEREKKLRKLILKTDNIEEKLTLYTKILNEACEEMKEKKLSLDLYYSYLNILSSYSQTSIIALSAASTFIQSIVKPAEQSNFIKVLLLSITSYSGFILAVSKFYKLDEKKENAHNLRDRFADLQTKIQYYVDYIKPWNDKAHYQHILNGKDKVTEWVGLIEKIENEYHGIIDSKRELSSNYDKIIDSYVTKKYTRKYLQIWHELEYEKIEERRKLQELKDKAEEAKQDRLDRLEREKRKKIKEKREEEFRENMKNRKSVLTEIQHTNEKSSWLGKLFN
tara:strand:+ start:3805 stop:4866 length:1062 start_codon:yes stop_codon:yes gene_type:complete